MNRIAIIAHGLSNGGAERVASMLANYLSDKGYKVMYIATYSEDQDYVLKSDIEKVFIRTKCRSSLFRFIDRNKKVYHELKRFKADKIIGFLFRDALLSVVKGYRIIFTLRNDPAHTYSNFIDRNIRSFIFKHSEYIVFQTKGAQAYFPKKIQVKSTILPNPLDVDKLPTWNSENHNKAFVTACRLNPQKNLPMMIEAFKKLHDIYSEYSLEIYGEGELREQLQKLINALKASDYIHLMGRSNNIHEIMSRSFAFVLSSDYEGLSNSMLEALAIGIPCICTDCPPGGAREYITNMKNGILVPCGDAESMYEGMKKLVENEELCKKFSQNSMLVRDELARDKICARWEQILKIGG